MRYFLPLVSLLAAALVLFAGLRPSGAEPAAKADDPWTGTYTYFAEYDTTRSGPFGEARHITITKEGDYYTLSKPYDGYKFKETKKGHLYDDKAIYGGLTLGSMEFGDGQRARVLRADFCYEHFYLVGALDDGKKPGATDERTKPEKEKPPLKIEEAEKPVRDCIFTENPLMHPTAAFPVKHVTTKPVWDRLDAQVFQVTKGVRACETYAIKDKKVYHIGFGFGGSGVSSMVVADPNGDGRDKLVFAFSWGADKG